MAHVGVFRRAHGGVRTHLDQVARMRLQGLFDWLLALLEEIPGSAPASADPLEALVGLRTEPAEPPADPALARLFPDAYPEAGDAAEFRRLTQADLRAGKVADARRVRDRLEAFPDGEIRLDGDEAEHWLGALNDLRLALGARLAVTADMPPSWELPADDPRVVPIGVYEWLGVMQESLVTAVAGE